jgi:hypothetical protein
MHVTCVKIYIFSHFGTCFNNVFDINDNTIAQLTAHELTSKCSNFKNRIKGKITVVNTIINVTL